MIDVRLIHGDCVAQLATLEAESVQTCITSPPYFGLRDYGESGQIGLEQTPAEYVAKLVNVFREVRRVLKDDGTLWLNLGDSISKKQLAGIPWRVAFALQADGWWLRSDIIWSKPNPMPESVTDRPTKAHEYLFLLAKSATYYYDADAVKEPFADERMGNPGACSGRYSSGSGRNDSGALSGKPWNADGSKTGRNRRSVWTVATKPYKGAHFATFPPKLIEPCVLAGSREGGTVLDPFNGAGTTGVVSVQHERNYIGIDLNESYLTMSRKRIADAQAAKAELLTA